MARIKQLNILYKTVQCIPMFNLCCYMQEFVTQCASPFQGGEPMLRRPPGQFRLMHAGAAVLLARICHELRIAPIVNSMVQWDERQCLVSPGTLVVALILNLLIDRKPLCQLQSFYERQDLDLLFLESVEPKSLNDDAFGRTLDRLAAVDRELLVQSVALCAIRVGEMEIRSVHGDTTSVSVQGEFELTDTDKRFYQELKRTPLHINHGHSKQLRPDLRQFTCGLVVSQDGVPLLGTIRDGSWSDKVWNREVLEAMAKSFLDPQSIVYVADSSLITIKNLRILADSKARFISRLPDNYKLTSIVKDKAFSAKKWQVAGTRAKTTRKAASYQLASFLEELDGRQYRLVVVRSSALDKRKEKKWERTVDHERTSLIAAIKELHRKRFACKPDAEQALQGFLESCAGGLHRVTGMVIAYTEDIRPPGRPRKGVEYPRETHYKVELRLFAPSEEARQAWLDRESSFVLITNLAEDEWSDVAILDEYKDQHKVEQNFRFTKHPIMADGTLLKSTRRVDAFGYVVILALLVAAFLQHRVRRAISHAKTPLRLRLQERSTESPTSLALLKELDYITTLQHITDEGLDRYLNVDLHPEHLQILTLAGYSPEIYVTPLAAT